MPILFDEFTPNNFRGRAAMSVDELKNALTIGDTVQLQSRYEELMIPKSVPRIITSNADIPADWTFVIPVKYYEWMQLLVGSHGSGGLTAAQQEAKHEMKLKMSNDAVAILRRSCFAHIGHSLVPARMKRKPDVSDEAPVCAKMCRLIEED